MVSGQLTWTRLQELVSAFAIYLKEILLKRSYVLNLAEKNALFTKVYGKPALKFEDIFDKVPMNTAKR